MDNHQVDSTCLHAMTRKATMPNEALIIQVRGLKKTYKQGRIRVEALRGVDLDIKQGEFVVIIGPSGGGKTTLLHMLGGVDRPTGGSILVNGWSLVGASERELSRYRREHVGFIFQFYNLLPSLNALDNVILPLLARGWGERKAQERGRAALEQVGLLERWRHMPGELSGGEQQRVAIARAMVGEGALILADEPTGDLDSTNARGIFDLMKELNQRLKTTFVLASHNLGACEYATALYEMRDGLLTAGQTK
jgi:ABC-type lipoprotein export system ATPase subunit